MDWCAEDGMSDPKFIQSALSRTIREDGIEIRIEIYKLETTDWSLEMVDGAGGSTVWDCLFPTDQAAFDEAMKAIHEEGIRTFLIDETHVTH
jgi:hypothetical protein